jgi:hypothetical protein
MGAKVSSEDGNDLRDLISNLELAAGPSFEHLINEYFQHKALSLEQIGKVAILRESTKELAKQLLQCPAGPDRLAALGKLREFLMFATQSILLRQQQNG